ncbi:MAG: hypothetical protein IIC61_10870 [Proteobacteria bacterium]|nr:hypothetical protein [Pseudomonadota bacterium]
MSENIDLSYRPETYWPEALDQEQLLTRIKGESRRNIARNILAEEGFAGLNAFLAREELAEDERASWGGLHPALMGGEYLPGLGAGEVEIARISLASVTSDQISIRVIHAGDKIRYAIHDEYESEYEYELAFEDSRQPLTLAELIEFIDGSRHWDEQCPGGLLFSHCEYDYSGCGDIEQAVGFAWINSAWYPQLSEWYEKKGDEWSARKEREQAEEMDADDLEEQVRRDGPRNLVGVESGR